MEVLRVSCDGLRTTGEPAVTYRITSYPLDAASLPFSANYTLPETAAVYGQPNE